MRCCLVSTKIGSKVIAIPGPRHGNCAGYSPSMYLQVMPFLRWHYDERMTHAYLDISKIFRRSFSVQIPIGINGNVIISRVSPPKPDTILMMMWPVCNTEQFIYVTLILPSDVVSAGVCKHHIIPDDLHLPLQNRPSEWCVVSGFNCHCLAVVVVVVGDAAAARIACTCALRARFSC